MSSTGALSLKAVPEKMVVIGAGVIGLELVRNVKCPIFSSILMILNLGFSLVKTWSQSHGCRVSQPDWWRGY